MLQRIILAPYYLVLHIRHALFDKGVLKSHPCEVPTVCIGNIAAGGTGKTPHTEMILQLLSDSYDWGNRNIAVLSRGHRRASKGFQQVMTDSRADFVGDEPLQIKKKFPAVTVAVDRPRVEGCRYLCNPQLLKEEKRARRCKDKELPPSDIIVLDDAFQYRTLKSWFNIVLVDYNRPVNKDCLLPFGRLRDLPSRLRKADIIIVTKCPTYLEPEERTEWVKCMGINDFDPTTCKGTTKRGTTATVVFTSINYCPPEPVYEEGDPHFIYSQRLVLFSGIAKDTPLRRYLSDTYKIMRHFSFGDHHKYSNIDVSRIMSAAKSNPTAIVATTEKDSQRIRDNASVPKYLKERMFYVPIKVYFLSDTEKEVFESTLLRALREFRPESGQTPRE